MEELHNMIRDGDFERLQPLVQSDFSLVDCADEKGKTAVSIAIDSGNTDMVKWLVGKGCRLSRNATAVLNPSVNDRVPCADLHCQKHSAAGANGYVNIVSSLIRGDESSDHKHELRRDTPHGIVSSERTLCNGRPNNANEQSTLDTEVDAFYPPLLTAVCTGSSEMAKLVLESQRAHVEDSFKNLSPLMKACDEGYTDIVALLIKYGASVNGCLTPEREDGDYDWFYRPLYYAVQKKHGDIVEMLVAHGASYLQVVPIEMYSFHVAAPSQMSQRPLGTLLELAVRLCQPSMVSFFIDSYRSDITDLGRYYALLWSVKFQQTGMTELLIEKLYPPSYNMDADELGGKYRQVLRIAVRECPQDDETVPLVILQRFERKLFPQEDGFFIILHSAVLRSLSELVMKLLEIGKDPSCNYDVSKYESWPDLCSAALYYGNKQILHALYTNGFLDLSTQCDGENAFFEAIFSGKNGSSVYEILSWLVDCGLDPSACDNNKMQPIHAAITHRLNSAVDALCRLGVDANATMGTDDLPTPLHLQLNLRVLQLGCDLDLDLIKVLVGHGADLAIENRKGYTPISILFWLLHANIRMQDAEAGRAADAVQRGNHQAGADRPDTPHDPSRHQAAMTNTGSPEQNGYATVNMDGRVGGPRPSTSAVSGTGTDAQNQNRPAGAQRSSSMTSTMVTDVNNENRPADAQASGSVVSTTEGHPTSGQVGSTTQSQDNSQGNRTVPQNADPLAHTGYLPRSAMHLRSISREVTSVSARSAATQGTTTVQLPPYLQPGSPWRTLTETLVDRFGVELFSMGAARLTGHEHWKKVYASLLHAGLDMGHLPTLRCMCWVMIRKQLGGVRFVEKVHQLPLPEVMKTYLKTL